MLHLACFGTLEHQFWTFKLLLKFFNYMFFVWLRMIAEGSVPEIRIWFIFFINSDFKCFIYLSIILFLYSQFLVKTKLLNTNTLGNSIDKILYTYASWHKFI